MLRGLVRVRRLPWVWSVYRVIPPRASVAVTNQRWGAGADRIVQETFR